MLEGTPEDSVILILGCPDGRPNEIYRLFQLQHGELVELTTDIRGGWHLDPVTGQLVYDIGTGTSVSLRYWGYCHVIERGWAYGKYEDALRQEARAEPGTAATLSQLIRERQRADKAEGVIRKAAAIVVGPELLAKTEGGRLTDLFGFPGFKHFAAFIADLLHDVFELLQSVCPDLELPKSHVTGIRHK